jgi:hypothetical protein
MSMWKIADPGTPLAEDSLRHRPGSAHEAAVHYAKVGGAKQSADLYAREKLGLLYAFAISKEHGELRQALGTAVGSEPDKG